jgi:predicted RNase H-like HicB family nuclease/predicted RNA binding protein YcfA (HicA-like mRNA interferase family)
VPGSRAKEGAECGKIRMQFCIVKMSRAKKVTAKILGGRADANLDFADLCFVLERAGFTRRHGKGSHLIFSATASRKSSIFSRAVPKRSLIKLNKSVKSSSNTNSPSNDMRYELIIYWSRADECFIVEVPELPGCMADGVTYEEAVANAQEVIAEWIATARSQGRAIPEPRGKLAYA